MKKAILICGTIAMIAVASCGHKSTPTASTAAKKVSVTYEANVKPLVEAKCTPCHLPAKGGNKAPLDTYAGNVKYIDDAIRRIQLAPTERGFMPFKHAALSAEEIAVFKNWKEQGLVEKN